MKATLLIVDPEVTQRSPSLKSLLLARPLLEKQGIRFEFLSQKCDLPGENIWHRIPGSWLPLIPRLWVYLFYIHLIWKPWHNLPKTTVVYACDGLCLWADIVTFHFFNPAWLRIEKTVPRYEWRDYFRRMYLWQGWVQDTLQLKFGKWKFLNAVSKSILDEIKPWVKDRPGHLGVLPNVIPAARFTKDSRQARRNSARAELGYSEQDTVFLFISQGHHRRKGFWLAVEAVARARERGATSARLHVVGGFPKTLDRLEKRLSVVYPRWDEWLVFVGSTPDPEPHFAAADALLFPSYFEAFSLVEIEAAAMGLPLLLTPHHGSEMILKDGLNGKFLPFDADAIATVLMAGIDSSFPSADRGIESPYSLDDFSREIEAQIRVCLETKY